MTRVELLAALEDEVRRPVPPARRIRHTRSQLEQRIHNLELRVLELETRSLHHRCRPRMTAGQATIAGYTHIREAKPKETAT